MAVGPRSSTPDLSIDKPCIGTPPRDLDEALYLKYNITQPAIAADGPQQDTTKDNAGRGYNVRYNKPHELQYEHKDDLKDTSDFGSLDTSLSSITSTVSSSRCLFNNDASQVDVNDLVAGLLDQDEDDVFVTDGQADGRASPGSDCTEDSGIETEDGMRARNLRTGKVTGGGSLQPVDIGGGIRVHKAGNGMLLKSLQDADLAETQSNGKSHDTTLNGHSNNLDKHDSNLNDTYNDNLNNQNSDHKRSSHNGELDTVKTSKRPPHIIPPEVRRIMRITSQSAPSSPIGRRRRAVSEYNPAMSPSSHPINMRPPPPPSFPAPVSPSPSKLLAGETPPPPERRRPRRNRLSWDPFRLDTSFDTESSTSSRCSTPSRDYMEGDVRFNFRVTPDSSTQEAVSKKGGRMVNGDSDTIEEDKIHSDRLHLPLKLDIGKASDVTLTNGSEDISSPNSPRIRRRLTPSASPRPQLQAPSSPTPRTRARTRSRASQALSPVNHTPVIRSKSASHLPPDHRLSVETKSGDKNEVLNKASKLQLELIKSKKVIEKNLSERLEEDMEKQDRLSGAIKRSMTQPRTKDQVRAASNEVKQVIHSAVVEDEETKTKYYKVEICLGNYTSNVTSRFLAQTVKISGTTPEPPRFSKEINLEFPDTVNMQRIDILQIGDKMILGVPFKSSAHRKPSLTEVLEPEGDPNDPYQRISFLEGLFKSLGLSWPPEGATAHYEYLTGRYMPDEKVESDDINYDYIFARDMEQTLNKSHDETSETVEENVSSSNGDSCTGDAISNDKGGPCNLELSNSGEYVGNSVTKDLNPDSQNLTEGLQDEPENT